MAYLNDIPVATDILAISQGQLLENFAQLETQFSIDHDSLLAAGATGRHFQLTMPEVNTTTVLTPPVTAADVGSLFTDDSGTETELYFRTESSGLISRLSNMINAYVIFDGSTGVIDDSYNVDSVTRTGAGQYTVNITAGTLLNTDYMPLGMAKGIGVGVGFIVQESTAGVKTVLTFPCVTSELGTIGDMTTVYLAFIGGR